VEGKPPATRRILLAARQLVARGGAAEISMGDVAALAGVSKALVHYHFHDKESLLVALVDEVGRDVVERERAAMSGSAAGHELDGYWEWLHGELARGDFRILLALAEYDSDRIRAESRRVAIARRSLAEEHLALVFTRLGLAPRLPAALLAETVVAFMDGLAAARTLTPERDPRPAFDVLWLGLLTLGD
jgi:AcrR family transcriptional regulator